MKKSPNGRRLLRCYDAAAFARIKASRRRITLLQRTLVRRVINPRSANAAS
jgi:hypothetical protein